MLHLFHGQIPFAKLESTAQQSKPSDKKVVLLAEVVVAGAIPCFILIVQDTRYDTRSFPHQCLAVTLSPVSFSTASFAISPKATMHIVCQTPNPILGVTPRYRPLSPLFE